MCRFESRLQKLEMDKNGNGVQRWGLGRDGLFICAVKDASSIVICCFFNVRSTQRWLCMSTTSVSSSLDWSPNDMLAAHAEKLCCGTLEQLSLAPCARRNQRTAAAVPLRCHRHGFYLFNRNARLATKTNGSKSQSVLRTETRAVTLDDELTNTLTLIVRRNPN